MPHSVVPRLKRFARKKGLKGSEANRYTYGTLTKMHKNKVKANYRRRGKRK